MPPNLGTLGGNGAAIPQMRFQYLDAPEVEILDLLPGLNRCSFCGNDRRCFSLERATVPDDVHGPFGCEDCLRGGRFGFCHDTEVGYLTEEGLTSEIEHAPLTPSRVFVAGVGGELSEKLLEPQPLPRPKLPPESLEGLRRTPRFSTWNEVTWLVHCADFMLYLGTWEPPKVASQAGEFGASPESLFAEMVDLEYRWLWRKDAREFGFAFHVFRCTKCERLQGIPDFD